MVEISKIKTKDDIGLTKESINLAEIAEAEGVELQEHRGLYRGRCPFHPDKDPSFFIYEEKRFKCFGCGAAGDVITFVQKIKEISFPAAMKYLGLQMTEREIPAKYESMLDIIEYEEWIGVDVKRLYGKRFISTLLLNELKRLSGL